MEIQVIVPWGKDKNLGRHYNRLMKNVDDWVCFLDHDILMLNPSWYHMCLSAVAKIGHRAGWITGVTNAIACPHQLCLGAPKGNDVIDHMRYAKKLYNKYSDTLQLMNNDIAQHYFSGFMILTHKEAWEATGGFIDGFLGVDNEYHKVLAHKNYQMYVMPGLYMYHTYHQKRLWEKI